MKDKLEDETNRPMCNTVAHTDAEFHYSVLSSNISGVSYILPWIVAFCRSIMYNI